MSGIAHPENFEKTMAVSAASLKVMRFPDHHVYSDHDIMAIESAGRDVDMVVTTEKDIWKIQNRVTLSNLQCAKVRVEWPINPEQWMEKIDALFC